MKRIKNNMKYAFGTTELGIAPGDTIVPKKVQTPIIEETAQQKRDRLKKEAKQRAAEMLANSGYKKPVETIKVATPEQRAKQQLVKDTNAANAEAEFLLNAEKNGMTREQYSKFLDKRAKMPDVQLDGMSKIGKDGEGCAGSEKEQKRRIKRDSKLALGTGMSGVSVKNYIESPAETMTRNDIAKAKADYAAMNDPLAQGIEIGSALLAQAAQSGMLSKQPGEQTTGIDNQITPAGTVMSPNSQINNFMQLPSGQFVKPSTTGAYGAKVKGDIEIEGKEVVQTPTGQVVKMQGPSHEEGGIDMDIVASNEELTQNQIPENSQVIPDRILGADGRTLADRAMTRERKERNIDKILNTNKTDLAVKNAANRKKSFLKKEATEDMLLQTMVQQMMQPQEEPKQTAKYGDPTVETQPRPTPYFMKELQNPGYNSFINNFGQVDPVNSVTPTKGILDAKGLPKHFAPSSSTPSITSAQTTETDAEDKPLDLGYLPKLGDLVGLYGNYKSGHDALKNTMEERAGDTANVNMYKDFGKRSLEKFSQSEEYLGLLKDEALKRSVANAAGLKKSGRNLRGIQQVQGAEFMANQNQNQAEGDIYAQNAAQMMQLMGQEAQFMGHQDQVVMGGEQARDLADRQDRSAYFTNKAQDLQTKATGLQQTGKDLNQIAMNPQMMALLKDFGKYFSVDNNGKLIAKATV